MFPETVSTVFIHNFGSTNPAPATSTSFKVDNEELNIAMGEQHKITVIRFMKLIDEGHWQNLKQGQLTTHVLDTAIGKPGKDISIRMKHLVKGSWETMAQGITNADGRISDLLPPNRNIKPGNYKMVFDTGNYFIANRLYAYGNTTPVDLQIPNDILNPYLEKYPNDLRIGTCGDGKVNVFNLEGKKEECDKNQESISCGINIGECKLGVKIRKCNTNCTWQAYGACNATTPKTEVPCSVYEGVAAVLIVIPGAIDTFTELRSS